MLRLVAATAVCALGGLAGCGGCDDHAARPDAWATDIGVDDTMDDAPDIMADVLDVPIDPECAQTSASCTTTPTTLMEITAIPSFANMARLDDTLYVSTFDVTNNGSGEVVTGGRITALDLVGGSQATLLPGTISYSVWAASGWAYAAEDSDPGTIWRFRPGVAPVALVTGRPTPFVVTADSTHVYWSEHLSSSTDVVMRRLIAGGPVETVVDCRSAWSLAVDDQYVYCEEFNQYIVRAPKSGATGTPIAGQTYPYTGLVKCASSLYATDSGDMTIQSVPLPNGPGSTFVTFPGVGRLWGIAASADYFYAPSSNLGVYRVSRTTAAYTLLVDQESAEATPVTWNGQLFYYSRGVGIRRCVD